MPIIVAARRFFATGAGNGASSAGGVAGGAAAGVGGAAPTAPGLLTEKDVPHFGQRIFIPDSGTRRSSTSYGALHDSHSTLNISVGSLTRTGQNRAIPDCRNPRACPRLQPN